MTEARLLDLLADFGDPGARVRAASELAAFVGARQLIFFTPDPELDVLLPAPGLPQTMNDAAEWRRVLNRFSSPGIFVDSISPSASNAVTVTIVRQVDGIMALVGEGIRDEPLRQVSAVLPLLFSTFRTERILLLADVRLRRVAATAAEARELAQTLDEMRKRLERALADAQAARQDAEHANTAKSAFLATMSHELRTPLNAMLGYSELLQSGVPVKIPDEAIQMVKRIQISARHLFGLIEEILTFSKLEAGEEVVDLETVPIAIILEEVLALTEPLALIKGLSFVQKIEVGDATMTTDTGKLRQMLLNLIGNAAKFTSIGGVGFDARVEGEEVIFVVCDTGPGIMSEELEQIFQPFFQSHAGHTRTEGGTGLGLTITRRLAQLMGGDVSVNSELGKGTEFTLRLPLRPRDANYAASNISA